MIKHTKRIIKMSTQNRKSAVIGSSWSSPPLASESPEVAVVDPMLLVGAALVLLTGIRVSGVAAAFCTVDTKKPAKAKLSAPTTAASSSFAASAVAS